MKKNFFQSRFFKILCLFFLVICLKLPILIKQPPAIWDEINYFEGIVEITQNHLNPFTLYWSYHPPFIMWTTAVIFKLFGHLLLITRLVTVFWAVVGAIFTYLLVETIIGRRIEAFLAGVLLIFSPLFMAQSGLFQMEVPLAAMAIVTVYFYFRKNWLWFGLTGSALVLTKEPGLLMFALILIFELIRKLLDRGLQRKWDGEQIVAFVLPFWVFITWMQFNKLIYGWYLWPYNWNLFTNSSTDLIGNLKEIYLPILGLFSNLGFWSPVLLIIIFIGIFFDHGRIFREKRILLLFFIVTIFPLSFLLGISLTRYLLPIYPFLFSLLAIFSSKIILKKFSLGIFVMIIFIPFLFTFWHKNLGDWEVNMNYLKIGKTHQDIAQFLENNCSDKKILTHWPFWKEWNFSYLGYVSGRENLYVSSVFEDSSLVDFDYVLFEKDNGWVEKVKPYFGCLILEKKFFSEIEQIEINLYKIDKNCLK